MAAANTLPASVQPKKGRLYAVIQTKENGKSKAPKNLTLVRFLG